MEQSSLGDSGVLVDLPDNEMSNSGILVEAPSPTSGRRIVKASTPTPTASNTTTQRHQTSSHEEDDLLVGGGPDPVTIISSSSDEELLQEFIEHDKQKRLQQLAADQRSKRSTKQAKGRTNPSTNAAQANPFSRFLTAFSVDTKYPHHKRSFHESEDYGAGEKPSKHARTEEEEEDDDGGGSNSNKSPTLNMLSDIAQTLRENISLMAVGVAVASLALMTLIRKKA